MHTRTTRDTRTRASRIHTQNTCMDTHGAMDILAITTDTTVAADDMSDLMGLPTRTVTGITENPVGIWKTEDQSESRRKRGPCSIRRDGWLIDEDRR